MKNNGIENDYFGQNRPPRKREETKTETELPLSAKEMAARQKFFGGDLLTILGQGPVKHIPKSKNMEIIEEDFTPEIEEEIKNMFGNFSYESMLQN